MDCEIAFSFNLRPLRYADSKPQSVADAADVGALLGRGYKYALTRVYLTESRNKTVDHGYLQDIDTLSISQHTAIRKGNVAKYAEKRK